MTIRATMSKQATAVPRPLPQRTCVACGTVRAKRELVRIVRTSEGRVIADPTGKQNGRGAYLCRQQPCWEAGVSRGRLERSLKIKPSAEDLTELREFAATLVPTEMGA